MNFSKLFIAAMILIALYTASMSTFNFFRTQKVGYINNSVLMDKYPEAMKAREQLNKKADEWKKNIHSLESELSELNDEILQNAGKWSKQMISAKEDSMKRKQVEYSRYTQAVSQKASQT